MRITNDCTPDEMLAELFAAGGTCLEDTAVFRGSSWSNHNTVCDELKSRVESLLRSYERLRTGVHVTQSMRDNGVDILLEIEDEGTSAKRRIGIQVKGNREAIEALKKPRNGPAMEAVLKAQAFDSHKWRLDAWWVVLCFDLTKNSHVELVRRINAELLQGGISVPIRIYEPAQAWNLLRVDEEEIDAMCVRRLCRYDEILVAAQNNISALSKGAYAVVYNTFGAGVMGSLDQSLRALMQLTAEDNTHDIDRTGDAINELESDGYLIRHDDGDHWSVQASVYPGLCALYFEGRVRHQLSHAGSTRFVFDLAPWAPASSDD